MKTILKYISARTITLSLIILGGSLFHSCETFVDLDPPTNQLTGEIVFTDATTVNAAFASIYARLRDNGLTSGGRTGIPYLMSHYADELVNYNTSMPDVQAFYENSLLSTNPGVANLWNGSYSLIYACNAILEGVAASSTLSQEDRDRFMGEAYFLRAFVHHHLLSLFGNLPYVDSTDYRVNSGVSRMDTQEVYQRVLQDLELAKELLPYENGEANSRPNSWVATALMARTYLYTEQWELSRTLAEGLIESGPYVMNTDIGNVFLKTSTETLWQLPQNAPGDNTLEGATFIFASGPPPSTALSEVLVSSFEAGDERRAQWIKAVTNGSMTWYHAYKYKQNTNTGVTQECSVLLRLAEIYLIAAEANIRLGHLDGARAQLNTIRERANLDPITTDNPDSLLDLLYHERRVEFFTEQGQRWMDLKRSGRVNEALSLKPNWDSTDALLPVPEQEILLNPNLLPQNDGY